MNEVAVRATETQHDVMGKCNKLEPVGDVVVERIRVVSR